MVENGRRALDRRSHIASIADALRVSVTDLTGQPYAPADAERSEARATVPLVRLALMNNAIGEPLDGRARPIEALRNETAHAALLRKSCEYADLGNLVAPLLGELHALSASDDEATRMGGLRLLVEATYATTFLLKNLGFPDLAWIAASRCREAAELVDDPTLIGVSEFCRAHAIGAGGSYQRAATTSGRAADVIGNHLADATSMQVYGMLQLTAAWACASDARPAETADHLAEADAMARRTGEGDAFQMYFGPTNVAIWRVALAVELGEGGRAVELARDVQPALLDSKSRQASFYSDFGRGLAKIRGKEQDALAVLRRAEDLAPQHVRNNPLVREAVADLFGRARRGAVSRELRGMAYRMGIVM
jgi:hypothetical protein